MVASHTNRLKGVTRLRSRDTTLGMPYVVAEEMAQGHQRVNGRVPAGFSSSRHPAQLLTV